MINMTNEVINSDTLVTYLIATSICRDDITRVATSYSVARYDAGFGGSDALHGKTVTLLGEMVGNQLPMLVQFDPDPTEEFTHALAMETVMVYLGISWWMLTLLHH
jgi:hypothetical protein